MCQIWRVCKRFEVLVKNSLKIYSFWHITHHKSFCWEVLRTKCGEFWWYIKFWEITLPLNQWRMLKHKYFHKLLTSLIEWKFYQTFEFNLIFIQNFMVPPSFAQTLSGKIIEGKVFGDKKKISLLYQEIMHWSVH